MSFSLPDVIHIISTIDDLLSMAEYPYTINTSTGYDEDDALFVGFTFPLRNGTTHVRVYDSVGLIAYENQNKEITTNIEFDSRSVAALNSSFKKAFKQVREFDRQQVNIDKSTNTAIDRASFGLANVN
jgi:hypothetical protein